jgi:MFS family permease
MIPFLEKIRGLPGKIKAVDSLKNPAFRMFFLSRLFNAFGVNTRQFSMSLLMYRLTGSSTFLGILILGRAVPLLLFSPVAGALADRFEKKTLILYASVADVLIAGGIGASLTTGYLSAGNPGSWWFLVTMAFLDGISSVFKGPSADAMTIEIVGEKLITNAIALNQAGQNTLRLIGPVAAGIAVDVYGFEPVYYGMAVVYAFSWLFMVFVPYTGRHANAGSNILNDIRSVLGYVKKERNILFVLVMVLCMVFFSMPYQQLLPIFTEDILKVGATELGLLQLVTGAGSIGGAIILASLPGNKKRGLLMLVSGVILGLSLAFFSFSTVWAVSIALMVGVGIGQAGRMTLPVALLQTYTRPEYRARVMSFYGVEFGLSSLGTFFAAILVDTLGVEWSVGGMAIVLVVLSLAALRFIPRLRKLD